MDSPARKLTLFFWAALVIAAVCVVSCAPTELKDESTSTIKFYATHGKPKFQFSQHGDLTLRYVESGVSSHATVLFIHGTPGSWTAFAGYVNEPSLQKKARLIAVDRPGWGGSIFANGAFQPSVAAQSRLMKNWLCSLSSESVTKRLIVVGHSLGATLAMRLAMDHPSCVSALLLLAGPLDPEFATPRWYNHVARVPPFGWLADKMIGDGMRQSNKEMMLLPAELRAMQPLWADIDVPTIIVQGGKDSLVDAEHADFAEKMMTGSQPQIFRLPEINHFFVFSDKPMVARHIETLLTAISQ